MAEEKLEYGIGTNQTKGSGKHPILFRRNNEWAEAICYCEIEEYPLRDESLWKPFERCIFSIPWFDVNNKLDEFGIDYEFVRRLDDRYGRRK